MEKDNNSNKVYCHFCQINGRKKRLSPSEVASGKCKVCEHHFCPLHKYPEVHNCDLSKFKTAIDINKNTGKVHFDERDSAGGVF